MKMLKLIKKKNGPMENKKISVPCAKCKLQPHLGNYDTNCSGIITTAQKIYSRPNN